MQSADFRTNNPFHGIPEIGKLEHLIEWALMFLSFEDKPATFAYDSEGMKFNLKTFDGALLSHSTVSEFDPKNDVLFNPFCHEMQLALTGFSLPDVNFKMFSIKEGQLQGDKTNVSMVQFRYAPKKELRGKKNVPFDILRNRYAVLLENETWYTQERFSRLVRHDPKTVTGISKDIKLIAQGLGLDLVNYGHSIESITDIFMKPKDFVMPVLLEHNTSWNSGITAYIGEINRNWLMTLSLYFASYYQWHVYIRESSNAVGFQVPVSPESYDDIFKMREVPLTRTGRRKAILHWVREHIRNVSCESFLPEKREVLVKKHLRGETDFVWNGMKVSLIPARYDLVKHPTKKQFVKFK